MSIKKEELKTIKISAKGTLISFDEENGIVVEDEKTGEQDTLEFTDIKDLLVGKSVNIVFANKEMVEEE